MFLNKAAPRAVLFSIFMIALVAFLAPTTMTMAADNPAPTVTATDNGITSNLTAPATGYGGKDDDVGWSSLTNGNPVHNILTRTTHIAADNQRSWYPLKT